MALMPTPSQAAAARLLQQRAAQAAQSDSTAAVVPVPADTLQGSPLADLVDAPSRLIANISDIFSLEAILVSGLKVILIIAISGLVVKLVDRALHIWNKRFEGLALIAPRRQRALTISTLLSSTVRYVVGGIALITVLGVLHIDVAALIATAGIAGIAIGFGAQSLVKDMIGGILLLFDDTIHVGDMIRIGTDEGWVEDIGVRTIKIRRFNGELLMVPAGDLRTFGNRSVGFVRAIVPVGLSYGQDTDRIMTVMQRVAEEYAADHKDILMDEEPLVQGITNFGESSVDARIVIKMIPGEQWDAERELRRRLKQAFDREGISIPFPQRTLHVVREEEDRSPFSTAAASPKASGQDQAPDAV
jgi:small-conductance mechanosensitive channel